MIFNLVDYFCGSGGSGNGLLEAVESQGHKAKGTFINHWDHAINTHTVNHPEHRHFNCSIEDLDLAKLFPGAPDIRFLWASPSCVFYSRARGDKPIKDQQRASAFCVIDFVRKFRPEAGAIENVPEFLQWSRLRQKNDKVTGRKVWIYSDTYKVVPDAEVPTKSKGESRKQHRERLFEAGMEPALGPMDHHKGETYRKWERHLRREGYDVEWKIIQASDYGDPTTRKRFFCRFVRRDSGLKIVWPKQTHMDPALGLPPRTEPWITARDIIEWDDEGLSIFEREAVGKKKLARNTCRRIAIGLAKYGLEGLAESIEAFILPQQAGGRPVHPIDEPLSTVTTTGAEAVVKGYLIPSKGKGVRPENKPVQTLTCESRGEGVATGGIIRMKGQSTAESPDHPLSTTTAQNSHGVVNAGSAVVKMRNTGTANSINEPLHTVTAGGLHYAIMSAFLHAVDLDDEEETILRRAWGKDWKSKIPNEKPRVQAGDNGSVGGSTETNTDTDVRKGPGEAKAVQGDIQGDVQGDIAGDVDGDTQGPVAQFGISIDHTGSKTGGVLDIDKPLTTMTTKERHAATTGFVSQVDGMPKLKGIKNSAVGGGATPYLVQFYSNGGQHGQVDRPLNTVTTKGRHAVVYPLVEFDPSPTPSFGILNLWQAEVITTSKPPSQFEACWTEATAPSRRVPCS